MKKIAMKAKEMKMEEWIWIGDSDASCHMTNDDTGMFEVKTIQDKITIWNGKPMMTMKVGKLKLDMM